MITQLFVPAVLADKSDVKYVIDQLDALSGETKGIFLEKIWDFGIVKLANDTEVTSGEVFTEIENNLVSIGFDGTNKELLIGLGENQISEAALILLIDKIIENRPIIEEIYAEYKDYLKKPIVKTVLGLEADASEGKVFVALTQNSVPILTTKDGEFAINGDVAKAFTTKISANIGAGSEIQEIINIALAEMNPKIVRIAEKINENIGSYGITRENVIYVLGLYDLYEEDPTAPAFSSSSPASGATGISTGATIKVTYNKNIFKTETFSGITLKAGSTLVETTSTIAGKVLTITPKSVLANNTTYTVTIPAGAIASEVMRPAVAVTFTFTTASSGGTVTPPSDGDTTPTTPTTPTKPVQPEEKDEVIEQVEAIIDDIKEEDIASATDTELTSIAQDVSKKLADATKLIATISDPQAATDLAMTLIEKSGALSTKLAVTNNNDAYDSLAKDVKQLTNAVMNNVSSLKVDASAITTVEGKTVAEIKFGEVEEGKLVDKATADKLDLIISIAQQLNQTVQEAGFDEIIKPVLRLDVTSDANNDNASVAIPSNLILAMEEKGVNTLEVASDVATFSIPTDAINLEKGSSIVLNSEKIDNAVLSEESKAIVGDAPVFDLFITVDGDTVSSFNKLIGVSVPYTLKAGENPEKITVFYINEKGELENIIGSYNEETKSVYFETNHFSQYTVKANNITFNDVDSKFWASNYIEVMASKGVIKGVGNDMFAPNNNVTRAEFAAMIIREFKLFDESAPNNFKDVNESDWFYSEVTAAAKLGIVQGRPGGLFAPNDKITREEMAKMLSNVLTMQLGKKIPANKEAFLESFKDNNLIADYAKDSVTIGARYNMLSGRPDGTFAPKDNANRAEAAKLIYMLFYINK